MVTAKKVAKPTTTRRRAAARKTVKSLSRPIWSTACPAWEDRIVRGLTLTPCPPLFDESAELAMRVFDSLQIVDAGLTYGDCREWVREFAAAVFGSYCGVPGHEDEGRRLIRTFFMLISKKNTKSTIAAGIMLTVVILNWRQDSEYLILSPTKEVADNSFKPIKSAIEADPELRELFHVKAHERTIIHRVTNTTLKVVAADAATVTGKKAAGVLVDELHEFGKVAKAEDMLVEATGGLMSRPEGFVIYLTTQSSAPPAGVFKKELEYARGVRDGKIIDPSYYPIIYEFPEKYLDPRTKPYMREENWYMVNPNLGASVDLEILRQKIVKSVQDGKDSIQGVVSKHLNIQVGLDLGADRWPAADYWLDNIADERSLDEFLDAVEVLTAGLDGGGLDDLLALTLTGRRKGTTDQFLSWSRCWVANGLLETRKEIEPRLRDFERDGDLVVVEVPGDDARQMAALLSHDRVKLLLAGIGIDPAKADALKAELINQKVVELIDDEPDPKFYVKVRQGWSLYASMFAMERALWTGTYQHCCQPIMAWCVGNAKVVQRGNAMLVTKEVSGKAKIDPVMSSFNAMSLMAYNPPARTGGYSFSSFGLLG